ncbi:MAG TPA: glycosyltransferase family 2 protein [candidate division Zixibacteria bacterium]|jgi:cellulose synthase/poly-beta-1,6-N-acetylglucosamine synthase-like glycosyltransferase|nr:glycosyltransferase family 2 protein [candidate division Zixibacteria bacterium]HBZ01291.1 glycosyltransferase family 2 protein [candidate division Zixibacteria bacterium]
MIVIEIIFWAGLGLIFWTYFGYYILLKLLSFILIESNHKQKSFPDVSIIVTAHNEEKRIADKIINTLSLDYPPEKVQLIIVSDGSTDRTVEIASGYCGRGVELLVIPGRHGKHYGQGEALKIARNDIVVLSDATTFLDPDSLKNLVGNFVDPKIGCVSGLDKVPGTNNGLSGEGAYVGYEMKLRDLESRVGSLVGASGSFYAVRKSLTKQWHPNMSNDFYLPIIARMKGFRTILDNSAIGTYSILEDQDREFQRKVRTVVHGIDVLFHFKAILNPFKYGFFSIQVFSHKLMRWLVPFALFIIFAANIPLSVNNEYYYGALACQSFLYLLTLLAFVVKPLQNNRVIKIPYFFVMANHSILIAWIDFIKGERYITWARTER